jgi:hypothetical protein
MLGRYQWHPSSWLIFGTLYPLHSSVPPAIPYRDDFPLALSPVCPDIWRWAHEERRHHQSRGH